MIVTLSTTTDDTENLLSGSHGILIPTAFSTRLSTATCYHCRVCTLLMNVTAYTFNFDSCQGEASYCKTHSIGTYKASFGMSVANKTRN